MARTPQRSERAREYHKLYNSRRWRAMRLRQLDREPTCLFCKALGRVTPATVADHRIPHRGDLALFWNEENLQSLCGPCHSGIKLNVERGGRPKQVISEDGWPVEDMPWEPRRRSPAHHPRRKFHAMPD
jgi:5-methylcytosine-specific restriction endonuclease McrA